MGDVGAASAAAVFAASNIFSWGQALAVPALQAAANIKILDRQFDQHSRVFREARQMIDVAVNDYVNGVESLLPDYRAALPDIPEAAEYVPVDPALVQEDTIRSNYGSACKSDEYIQAVNRLHEQNDMIRSVAFDPRFLVNMDIASLSIQDLMRGKLPVSDLMEITTDCAERAAMTGRIGNTRKTLARDLGISSLRAQAFGRQEMREHMSMINRDISSTSRQGSIMSMAVTPAERIGLALTQAQLVQNSLQNKNNTLAQKDPYLFAQLQTRLERLVFKLQFEASKANLTNTSIPNYAAILQPQIQEVADRIGTHVGAGIPSATNNNFFGQPPQQAGSYVASTPSAKSSINSTRQTSERTSYFGL